MSINRGMDKGKKKKGGMSRRDVLNILFKGGIVIEEPKST